MKVMKIVLQIVAVFAVYAICGGVISGVKDNPWLSLLAGALTVAAMVFVYRWVVKRTENREVTELQGKGATRAASWGLLFGTLMFLCVISNIYLLGDYEVDGIDSVSGAIGLIGFMAGAAVTEEIVFRGLLFRLVERGAGTYIALVLSGLVFGGMHLLNDDATLAGALAISVEAGAMLAAGYAATRNLWLPMGVHFAWNYMEAGIFSTQVSGSGDSHGLLEASLSGNKLVTGGEFGPEASLYAVLFGTLLTVCFLIVAHRRGNIVPLRRAERADTPAALVR
ncbi:membrane protease YdiL (CAAX protease family) [Streptomyces sp. SAI-135]|nr:membrane protease YdiL (CAAX protease family) [Streptomyces sp. SAI-090]MDH6554038.1 membrane protease YdiL (CAAX protease family) [Streptomyces sp. SAI-041]MDH6573114.1 membrane protease YdiL (CAAX protease family) [Streptomyces sp. SAI-117]MDH6581895.1 membrane protease YdiL (CAAX protease family) [Streptomyces sp. SAI-133]MDH6614154.1 membrane protease YdiL (CAAX protease family) [Streptomyces sp. SAI-135]